MPLLTGAIQRGCTDNTGGVHACLHAPISFRARARARACVCVNFGSQNAVHAGNQRSPIIIKPPLT
jgi:hypothetical protein